MADTKEKASAAKGVGNPTPATDTPNGEIKPKMDKRFRPLYSEIARLSATLGMARTACQNGEPEKVMKAFVLLGKQLELAVETAELLVPGDTQQPQ